jgi:KUP system potassium uptake protein
VIASQALISGAFSLTHQAVHLGLFPRVTVDHTSATTEGQIYLREINWTLAIACIALVLHFKSSTGLAAAYGIAVCGTMAITSVVFVIVARIRWQWSLLKCGSLLVSFLIFDLGFLAANLLKITHGGYLPIVAGLAISLLMITWTVGRTNLAEYYRQRSETWDAFARRLDEGDVLRTSTVGVFMASDARGVPAMVLHQARRIRAVPGTALLVTINFEHVPWVTEAERLGEVTDLGHGFHRVVARFGFMQEPDVPPAVDAALAHLGLSDRAHDVTYYLGRESLIAASGGKMGTVLEGLFRALARNAMPATTYFCLPHEQVVEIGVQIDL